MRASWRRLALALALAAGAGASPGTASAQSISPMIGEVAAFGEEFAVRVTARNPFKARMGVVMRAYDNRFRPIPARFSHSRFNLGAGGSRPVTVLIPFDGTRERYVRVCAEAAALRGRSQNVRTRVCGRFRALRR